MYYLGMKISKTINAAVFSAGCLMLAGIVVSCGSAKVEPAAPEPVPVVEEPKVEEVVPSPAPLEEEPTPVVEEPVVEAPVEAADADDEYSRSVGAVAVDRDTFVDDKEKVLRIISELDSIMKNLDYNSWLPYVEPASIDYWKLRKNLQKAEKRLPVKGIKLRDLQDYFKQVFVPARKGRTVTEIRYISDSYIKAVQVQEREPGETEDHVTVYYYFNKNNGRWMVHLPTNEELN